ncbi:unnamed protein product, partial [Oikopleura dioica]
MIIEDNNRKLVVLIWWNILWNRSCSVPKQERELKFVFHLFRHLKSSEKLSLRTMKVINAFISIACATFKQSYSHKVERNVVGEWVDNNLDTGRFRRDVSDSFRPFAAMIVYLKGLGSDNQDPSDAGLLEAEMQQIQDQYTSYGCYCWANGVDNVEDLGSGSRNIDAVDNACTE